MKRSFVFIMAAVFILTCTCIPSFASDSLKTGLLAQVPAVNDDHPDKNHHHDKKHHSDKYKHPDKHRHNDKYHNPDKHHHNDKYHHHDKYHHNDKYNQGPPRSKPIHHAPPPPKPTRYGPPPPTEEHVYHHHYHHYERGERGGHVCICKLGCRCCQLNQCHPHCPCAKVCDGCREGNCRYYYGR